MAAVNQCFQYPQVNSFICPLALAKEGGGLVLFPQYVDLRLGLFNRIIPPPATQGSKLISSKVGEDTNVCASYIKNLISLGIVQKETPYGEKASRKSLYSIEGIPVYPHTPPASHCLTQLPFPYSPW